MKKVDSKLIDVKLGHTHSKVQVNLMRSYFNTYKMTVKTVGAYDTGKSETVKSDSYTLIKLMFDNYTVKEATEFANTSWKNRS